MRKSSGASGIASTLRGEAERFAQVGGDRIGGGFELVAGVAARGDAMRAQCEVASVVVLESDRATVVVPEVGLDGDPLLGEEEVDQLAVDAMVDQRPREVMALAEGEEEQLKVGAASVDEREVRHAVPGELRLAERAAEEVGGLDRAADVRDRAGGRRHRNAGGTGDVAGGGGAA